MTRTRRGLGLLCHQALVLAVVGVVAAAALLVPSEHTGTEPLDDAVEDEAVEATEVAAAPVEPEVRRVALQAADDAAGGDAAGGDAAAPGLTPVAHRTGKESAPATQVAVSPAEPVEGYGTVGVTWDTEGLEEDEVRVEVRTEVDGAWSAWQEMEYHPEHAPDPGSREGRAATVRAGTDPVVVGEVDRVQVRATTEGSARALPVEGMALDIVDPGTQRTVTAEPAFDTATPTGAAPTGAAANARADLALAAKLPYRPKLYTRAQWGADERLRDKKSLTYGSARVGFVHHTVNANNYRMGQVPSIIRGIYAYHTKSRGWSDIGYNFLVDRFGRIFEGRAGGMLRSVVGAHTYGYNSRSFAISAIGNFETVRPSAKMVMAYGTLMGWKLSVHRIDARKKRVLVTTGTSFAPVSGHRDAGATACPGRYLYSQLPTITRRAAWLQKRAGVFG